MLRAPDDTPQGKAEDWEQHRGKSATPQGSGSCGDTEHSSAFPSWSQTGLREPLLCHIPSQTMEIPGTTRGESPAPGRFCHVGIATIPGRFCPVGPALCPQIPQRIWMVLVVSLVSLELWSACREAGSTLMLQSEIIKKKKKILRENMQFLPKYQ